MQFTPILSIASALALLLATSAQATPSVPFDEQTLDRIDALNQAITDHYERLQETTQELEARRGQIEGRVGQVEGELKAIEVERQEYLRTAERKDGPGLSAIEEHEIETKSRYLEALAEKHALDQESTRSFETHATAILVNLERLATALEESGRLDAGADEEGAQRSFQSLQQGTAVALSVLEDWGALERNDPRFRALWATSRVLNRSVKRMQAGQGVKATVDLVRERTFVVRSLIDQSRALRAALDQQGLLLQVAAQNQMLRLHFTRLGAINGLELPDLDIDETTRRIFEDIEEEPFGMEADAYDDGLNGFDDCLQHGHCE